MAKTLSQLKSAVAKAKALNNVELHAELNQILATMKQPWPKAFRLLSKLLQCASSQISKHYIADLFGEATDPQVLKPLMRAAKASENREYSSNFIFPCAQYDCTDYVNFFVQFLLTCKDPGEAMAGCVHVIEEMQGPFDSDSIRINVAKLLGRDRSMIPTDLQTQDEVLTLQAAYALLDKYFSQVDRQWNLELRVSS
ncbi:hypothetical protein [Hymenobacter guriensis]|uniref:Uncharacterized protein n=1 Tax=Hymenobacter guriensis TaxID=2793065 RepID=A0ABS0L467_9BACT|nr:hypothetical protein [Hymenobacter guriensis]MBG8554730.1 hypothetical protein [Hymenobacter guriensis]